MLKLGYKLMSEEHGPSALVGNARKAEDVGFDFAAISDHFFPWVEEQGHSPLAWSVLGAVAHATERLGLMTAVTCPTMRYHPAIIAQGTATLALLSDNRFTLGLGSGERLNEHIIGVGWPGLVERQARFGEAIDIIQGLLRGDLTNFQGEYLRLENARLFDMPSRKPPVVVAAGGEKAAKLAGEKADGIVATDADHSLLSAYQGAGGKGPRYAEVAMCLAAEKASAIDTAHKHFRWSLTGWPVQAELDDPEAFASASKHIQPEAVAEQITCGPSIERHVAAVKRYVDAGFDHIILVQVGQDQGYLFQAFKSELASAIRELKR